MEHSWSACQQSPLVCEKIRFVGIGLYAGYSSSNAISFNNIGKDKAPSKLANLPHRLMWSKGTISH